ncbi:MAG: DUF4278 domain-containing protein [Cyanobacteria bacterium CRU_2_1]|nr:DUF4278 domain-containing protein [Cyanobacteria bacterium RU_5_0]NJR57827.1 DUF4278 domain-containing protein [Cyanobacteria bacterium CRU_2_1]
MKLTFRGHSYKVPAPIQISSASMNQTKVELIYRGHKYYTTPPPAVVSEAIEPDESTVTLIYRGTIYDRKLQPPNLYQKFRAINWRYQHLAEG